MGKRFNSITHIPELDLLIKTPSTYQKRTLLGLQRKAYIDKLQFTDLQKCVLIGTLLGDGCLANNGGQNFNYKFDQKAENLPYVNLIYSILAPMVGTPPAARFVREKLHSYWFSTYRLPSLKFYADTFYFIDPQTNERRRRVPPNIHQFLNPIVLAFWYMDDGSMNPTRTGVYLHTENFPLDEVKILQQALGRIFHLETSIHKDGRRDKTGKIYSKLFIAESSVCEFMRLVSPHMHPCMEYKIRKFEDDLPNNI